MSLRTLLRPRVLIPVAAVVLAGAALGVYWLWPRERLPGPGSPAYEEYVEAFQAGVAALDADVPQVAEEKLTRAIELVPQEPAAWIDRGLLYIRTNRLDLAARDLEEARRLAPDRPEVEKLLGLLAERRGRFDEAAEHLRRAAERDPQDVETLYRLARVVDQQRGEGSEAEYQRLLEKVLAAQPNNLFVLSARLRAAVRGGDRAAVRDTLARFKRLAPGWSGAARTALADLDKALAGPLGPAALPDTVRFANLLLAEPGYQRSAEAVNPQTLPGTSVQTFLRLRPPSHTPAPPDTELTFTGEPVPGAPPGRWDVALPVWLTGEGKPAVFVANAREVRQAGARLSLRFPGGAAPVPAHGVVAADWNNDFRTDFLLAGPGGLRFYRQQNDGSFLDVTAGTSLPAEVLQGDYHGAWAVDVDLDGDLDFILARRKGPPLLLRNNFDGTFTPLPIFPGVDGARAFAWADLDHDGAPDAALLDERGYLHVFANERSGQFRKWPAAPPGERFLALAVADANDDGVLDLVALRADGALLRLSDKDKRSSWDTAELARWRAPPAGVEPGGVCLLAADLDNNGVPDLLASGPARSPLWLGAGGGKFEAPGAALPGRLFAAADLAGNGRLDLLGLDAGGRPVRLRNAGKKDYHWQAVRPLANRREEVRGDNRINSFALGAEVEVRTGTHVVKQPVTAPVVHFGLGERTRSDVVRILWPNGTSQVEFDPPLDKTIVSEQRLKGSCPFLFTWDGERFTFVSDFMWSTPLGMYINAQDKGGFLQTTDWVKVRGDQLVPRGGRYEVRVTANLWETHYYDQMALLVVDHPPGTEMFVDERFFLEPATPQVDLTGPPRPVARARDHRGQDVTDLVRAVDRVYLDTCGRGTYQGVTRDHWVEIDLGDDAPREGPLWLVAHGWVHPTDSSINYALEQGRHDPPRGLVLEVPDGKGGWKVARDKLGFPAGKNKTVLIRLDGIEGRGVTRRFRLRTNMEIFWDALHYARGLDASKALRRRLAPARADLRFRGILEMTRANASSPELPHYDRVVARGQYWRDLIGFHTRYGDVRELLAKVDDRYVILCGGDEIALSFEAPPGPPAGWKRDFVWACDGWVKDGDLNTRFGKTVLPLPAHDIHTYVDPPGRLEDDPVYRRFPNDWKVYHTRYVTPHAYERGLRNFRRPGPPR